MSAACRRLVLAAVGAALFTLGALALIEPVAGASGSASAPTTTVVPLTAPVQQKPSIIPLPNSGSEPVEQGDPGSATQYAVLFGTMAGMVLIALLVRRESRRKAANRTPKPGPTTPSEAAGVGSVDEAVGDTLQHSE
ncbi:MAG: hypothetical protein U0Q22_14870 [Acidimicrobiales bacterium]